MVGRNNRRSISAFALVFVFLVITTPGLTASKNARPAVAVVNYPLKYFTERIGGNLVRVIFPIPRGIDPAFWTPEPEGVLAFQSTDLILLNGATYSKWLDKVTLSRSKLVSTSGAFKEQYIKVRNLTTHAHGPGGEHAHAGMAFTTWIDFQLAVGQAEAIRDALKRLVPQEKERFEANFSALKNDLMALDRRVGEIVASEQGQLLVASHPVYDYFARRYGLNIRSVLWEPEDFPSAKQWAELRTILKQHPAKWMIWEGKPNPAAVDKLKLMGVSSLVFDPAGNVPDEGDFLSIMRQNVENLRAVFSK